VGADLDLAALPLSTALKTLLPADDARMCAAGGGDDYELCFTVPANRRHDVQHLVASLQLPLTRIGSLLAALGIQDLGSGSRRGYQHFS